MDGQTDSHTDGWMTYDSNTALALHASHNKNELRTYSVSVLYFTEFTACTFNCVTDVFMCACVHVCVVSSGRTLGDGVVGKAPIMTICTWQYSGGVNLVSTSSLLYSNVVDFFYYISFHSKY